MGFVAFLLGLHGSAFLVATLWLAKQHNNWAWPRRRGAKARG